jgi:hypothetical protein
LRTYPDAKVLLSVRDGEAWEHSMGKTIWGIFYGDMMIRDLSTAWSRVDPKWASYITLMRAMWKKSGLLAGEFEGTGTGEMAKAMERYNEEVKRTVTGDRLLVWSPADGWAPLCEFLEVPVPKNVPLPHLNDAKQFGDRVIDAAMRPEPVVGPRDAGQCQGVSLARRTGGPHAVAGRVGPSTRDLCVVAATADISSKPQPTVKGNYSTFEVEVLS